MKTYRGYSDARRGDGTGPAAVTVTVGGRTRPLRHRVRHSPAGFSWGYGGSGPADLARAILWDHLGREPAPALYQRFKFAVVARFPIGGAWELTETEIAAWMAADAALTPDGG